MTDKIQKIREEVEKLKSQLLRGACSSQIAMETHCKEEAYNEVLAILDTLQEESVSEELKKAAVEAFKQIVDSDKNSFLEIFKAGAEWGKNQAKVEIQAQSMALAWLEKQGNFVKYYEDKLDRCACENFNKGYKKALEKQGEQKPTEWHREDEQNLNACLGYIPDEFLRRWLKDAVHVKYDKPKFKVGDWVVNRFGDVWHIDSVDKENYQVSDREGNHNYFSIANQDEMYLWTIQDAKDGDVLATENFIFIFKNIDDDNGVHYYCQYEINKHENDNQFDVALPQSLMGRVGNSISHYSPATKEQRDLLFQKMKEAGYVWNAEKKELTEIEQKKDMHNKLTDFKCSLKHIMEEAIECGDTHNLNADADMLLRLVQNSAWSEEDEETFSYLEDVVDFCYRNQYVVDVQTCERVRQLLWRLKSLCFQSKWSKDDITRVDEIIETLNIVQANRVRTQRMHYNKATIDKNIDWLKSLKDRVQPQPKREWSEEDDIMIDVLSVYEEKAISNGCPNDAKRISNAIDKLKSFKPQNTCKPSIWARHTMNA